MRTSRREVNTGVAESVGLYKLLMSIMHIIKQRRKKIKKAIIICGKTLAVDSSQKYASYLYMLVCSSFRKCLLHQ